MIGSSLRVGLFGLAIAALPACSQAANEKTSTTASTATAGAVAAPTVSAAASRIATDDREAIEAIIRDYLVNNPDVLEEALVALNEKRKQELSDQLASDPRDFSMGPEDAPITVVEYFDYRCGYCKRAMDWLIDVAEDNPDDVRVVFKEFPILSAQSREAAYAALAADRQGKYFEMHQALMSAPSSSLEDEDIDRIAKAAGVDVKQMRRDMNSAEIRQHVVDIRQVAAENGANSTPTFFVNGEMVAGADIETLDRLIEEARS